MIRILLACILLAAFCLPAAAQQKKEFPADQCSYALPGADWKWLDPSALKNAKLTALASSKRFAFSLEVSAFEPGEIPSEKNYYPNFETNYLRASKSRKISGEDITFRGLPAYRFNAKMPADALVHGLRIETAANDRTYHLLVTNSSGVDSDVVQEIFDGFDFIGAPEPVFRSRTDKSTDLGAHIGLVAFVLVGVGAVALVAYRMLRRNA